MSYLLDTNTVSEVMKPSPETCVLSWLELHEKDCFFSALSVGEIEKGIFLLPSGQKKDRLQEVFQDFMRAIDERVLNFDVVVARRWAVLTGSAQRKGRTLALVDSMIEATALHWGFAVVTRNTSDFIEVQKVNPWQQQ